MAFKGEWWCRGAQAWIIASSSDEEREACVPFLIREGISAARAEGEHPRILRLVMYEEGVLPSLQELASRKVAETGQTASLPRHLKSKPVEAGDVVRVIHAEQAFRTVLAAAPDVVVVAEGVMATFPSLLLRFFQCTLPFVITASQRFRVETLAEDFPCAAWVHADCSVASPLPPLEESHSPFDPFLDPRCERFKGTLVCPECEAGTEGSGYTASRHIRFHSSCYRKINRATSRRTAERMATCCGLCALPLTIDNVQESQDEALRGAAEQARKDDVIRLLGISVGGGLRYAVFHSYLEAKNNDGDHFFSEITKVSTWAASDTVRPYIEEWQRRIASIPEQCDTPSRVFASLPLPGDGGMGMQFVEIDQPDDEDVP